MKTVKESQRFVGLIFNAQLDKLTLLEMGRGRGLKGNNGRGRWRGFALLEF